MDSRYDEMPSRHDPIVTDTGRDFGGLNELEEAAEAVAAGVMDAKVREEYDAQGPGGFEARPQLEVHPSGVLSVDPTGDSATYIAAKTGPVTPAKEAVPVT